MTEIVQLQPWHLAELRLQEAQAGEVARCDLLTHAMRLIQSGPALAVLAADGRPVAAGGLAEVHPHYATAWALLGADAGAAMTAITRAVRRVLASGAWQRVDTTVRSDFVAGHRWAVMLGFSHGATMRMWGPDRSDHDLYERIS